MIKAVIFDMDGLMFDTERLALYSLSDVGNKIGLDITEDIVHSTIGLSWDNVKLQLFSIFGEFDFDNMKILYQEYIDQYIEEHGLPIKRGLEELIFYINKSNLKKAICTGSYQDVVSYYLKKSSLDEVFDTIVTGDLDIPGKPAPDIYIHTAKLLGVKTKECMVLEDSPAGIKAAYDAGAIPVMVRDLVEPTKETEMIALRIVDSLFDIIALIEDLKITG